MSNSDDIELLQQLISHGGTQAFSLVPAALRNVLQEKLWDGRTDKHGKPFASFEAFATHRLWQGLETTLDDLRVHCRKEPAIYKLLLAEIEPGATLSEAGAKGGRGNKASDNVTGFQGDNITSKSDRGNSALYTLKRLKRDRPDLFQVVLGGGMSPNAAAIEAGFRKQPTPLARMAKLALQLTDLEWAELKRAEDQRRHLDRESAA
jgi:hypothetical protein